MTLKGLACSCAIKAAGAIGVGMLGLDAHKKGKRTGEQRANRKKFEAMEFYYQNSRDVPTGSYVNSKLKDKLYDLEIKNGFRRTINKGKGYISGFFDMMVDDAIPWGLSLAALLTKGTAAKVSGIGLAAYSAYAFCRNILGLGSNNQTKL